MSKRQIIVCNCCLAAVFTVAAIVISRSNPNNKNLQGAEDDGQTIAEVIAEQNAIAKEKADIRQAKLDLLTKLEKERIARISELLKTRGLNYLSESDFSWAWIGAGRELLEDELVSAAMFRSGFSVNMNPKFAQVVKVFGARKTLDIMLNRTKLAEFLRIVPTLSDEKQYPWDKSHPDRPIPDRVLAYYRDAYFDLKPYIDLYCYFQNHALDFETASTKK